MICKTCKESGIVNKANGKEFYFCKKCRIEITLEDSMSVKGAEEEELSQKEIDDLYNDFYYVNGDSYLQIYQDYEQECLSISPHWSDRD